MPLIRVDAVAVEELAARTQSVAAAIAEAVDGVTTAAQAIIGSSWVGLDAQSFETGLQGWAAGAAEVQSALEGIAALLGQASTTYETNEDVLVAEIAQ